MKEFFINPRLTFFSSGLIFAISALFTKKNVILDDGSIALCVLVALGIAGCVASCDWNSRNHRVAVSNDAHRIFSLVTICAVGIFTFLFTANLLRIICNQVASESQITTVRITRYYRSPKISDCMTRVTFDTQEKTGLKLCADSLTSNLAVGPARIQLRHSILGIAIDGIETSK